MNSSRLEAFSDGVLAIIITITVLSIRVPDTPDLAGLKHALPVLAIYAWSFQVVGTYWNNHHHLVHGLKHVSPGIMWANLHLLFWLSLVPLTTEWLGRHFAAPWPTAAYCAVLFLAAIAYTLLEQAIIAGQGRDSGVAKALHRRMKEIISLALYGGAILVSFVAPWVACAMVVAATLVWLLPDRRLRAGQEV
jgi:uncharacterized membrane protein